MDSIARPVGIALLFSILVAAPAPGQDPEPDTNVFSGHMAARRFQEQHGPEWSVRMSSARGNARHVFGGHIALAVDGSDTAFEREARRLVDELAGMLGFGSDALELVEVKRIRMAHVGSSDKVSVEFQQTVGGVPVHRGYVNVLFGADGKFLSLDNQAMPLVEDVRVTPTVSEVEAMRLATSTFEQQTGKAVGTIELTDYVVYPVEIAAGREYVRPLAAYIFRIDAVRDRAAGELPVARSYVVAARGGLRLLDDWNEVHSLDITGKVEGMGQPGLLPDLSDPHQAIALKDVLLQIGGEPDQYSDDLGDFTFPNVNTTSTVIASLDGQWSRVVNDVGADISVAMSFDPGVSDTIVLNADLTQLRTAEVNAHYHVNAWRDWLKSVDPSETTFDFQVLSFVNTANICQAFFLGSALEFYQAGYDQDLNLCVNTAYATVAYHEQGHYANVLYNSGNGSDGFGEGAADTWAMYIANSPILGQDFNGPGTFVRTGLNTRQFCGDENPGCYGQIHDDGEPLMGALWKVRANLQATHGDGPGGDIADNLLLSWFQAYNDGDLTSVIEEHWICLDDDNGDLTDGTPNLVDIIDGFDAQGFPIFAVPIFDIQHVPNDLVSNELAVTIAADVTNTFSSIDEVRLYYSTDGGANFTMVTMPNTSGPTYKASIPGQNSPAVVDYYLEAEDPNGIVNRLPAGAPATFFYDVGVRNVLLSYDFEAGDDEGWTHSQIMTQDDWQRGCPVGDSTDPSSAFSGTNCWGNDLGFGINNGAYFTDVINRLLSPTFDFTGEFDIRVRFRRWLGVEASEFDQAEFYVEANSVWMNPMGVDLIDTGWKRFDIDVSTWADDDPTVFFGFRLASNDSVQMGGWNVDDFEVVTLGALGGGLIKPVDPLDPWTWPDDGGGDSPTLTGAGDPAVGERYRLRLHDGPPGARGMLVLARDRAGTVGLVADEAGGRRSGALEGVLGRVPVVVDASGRASVTVAVPDDDRLAGASFVAQVWLEDPRAPDRRVVSNGLQLIIH